MGNQKSSCCVKRERDNILEMYQKQTTKHIKGAASAATNNSTIPDLSIYGNGAKIMTPRFDKSFDSFSFQNTPKNANLDCNMSTSSIQTPKYGATASKENALKYKNLVWKTQGDAYKMLEELEKDVELKYELMAAAVFPFDQRHPSHSQFIKTDKNNPISAFSSKVNSKVIGGIHANADLNCSNQSIKSLEQAIER